MSRRAAWDGVASAAAERMASRVAARYASEKADGPRAAAARSNTQSWITETTGTRPARTGVLR